MKNSRDRIYALIIALGDLYDKELNESRAKGYLSIIGPYLVDMDLDLVFKKVGRECEYFPTPQQILSVLGKSVSVEQRSTELVDEIIAAASSSGNAYELLGREKYQLMRSVLGFIPFDVRNGNLKPHFLRGAWIDKMKAHLEGRTPNAVKAEIEESKRVVALIEQKRKEQG